MRFARSAAGVVLAIAALTRPASAEIVSDSTRAEDPTLRPVPAERRSGLVLGASGGVAFAGSSGYPNSARLIGNPDVYSSTPLLAGWSSSWFLMGALTDWFSFGPTFTIATFDSAQWKSTGWGAGFRAEVFPLARVAPVLADTAIYGQLGVGHAELRAKGPYPTSDGTQSYAAIGLHHEWRLGRLLGGHAAAGPHVEYNAIRADAIERHWLTVGLRVVWYGGRVKLDE